MIIQEKVKDVIVIGQDTSKKAKISQDKLGKLQYLLTKGLYKDPITAVIAEWTNNGIDSVVQSGKNPIENPVLVKIEKGNGSQYLLKVEDQGVGLDDKDFEDICMNYLESTKETSNELIGSWGIGMKSFLSLERTAIFTCRKNGKERKYLVYEGAEFVNYDLLYEGETNEENGVIAELVITNYQERSQFIEKAKQKLAYYDTAILIIDGVAVENKIYRNEVFQWSTLYKGGMMHLCLKDVYYTIDWDTLGISPIRVPVALRINLGDGINPTPSRESYITNEKVKQLLKDKIRQVAEWFINRYNETVLSFKTFMDAYPFLGRSDHYVDIEEQQFLINPLLSFTNIKPSQVKIEGVIQRDPNWYKINRNRLLDHYSNVAYISHSGSTKIKNIYISKENHVLEGRGKTVIIHDNFRGNVKEFLKYKYGTGTLFLKPNGLKRALKSEGKKIDTTTYKNILQLSLFNKYEWRKIINEWNFVVTSIVSTFKDETDVENSKDFQDWLEEKREKQRELRRLHHIKGVGLDKKQGDVTLGYSYLRYGKIHFDKKAYPISKLTENRFLTVLVEADDDHDLVKSIILRLKGQVVRFATVGKLEIKKIPDHFQFVKFKKFMTRDCKPFMRLASAIKFQELLMAYDKITNLKHPIFDHALGPVRKSAKELKTFVESNTHLTTYPYIRDNLKNDIIDIADEKNLYDMSIWSDYLRVKEVVEKYDFVGLMDIPSTHNVTLRGRFEKVVNQMLLFRKKYYNDLPEGTKIIFEEPVAKTEKI